MSTGPQWFGDYEPAQHDPRQPAADHSETNAPDAERARRSSAPADAEEVRENAGGNAAGAARARSHPDAGRPDGARGARSQPEAGRPNRARRPRSQPRTWQSGLGARDSGDRGRRAGADRRDRRETAKEKAPYPIVAQHLLGDVIRGGRVLSRKRRDGSEIPQIRPHEVLVWRVGSRYIVDPRELQAHEYNVVHASSVSVVSVRPGTEVQVEFQIDTQDAAEFVVRVTFACSVVDPVTVVRDGQVSAADALLAYLHAYPDLFQLGLKYSVTDVNKIRTAMAFHVKSYMTHYPPRIPGIEIGPATVQVDTPATLGKIQEINQERQIELARKEAEAAIAARVEEATLRSARKISEAIGDDPRDAVIYAHADGSMTSQETAQQLQQMYESDAQREHLDEMARNTRQYAVEDRDAGWEHEDRVWQRNRDDERYKEDREDRRSQVKANIELLKIYADRGYLDTANPDIENIIRRIQGEVPLAPGVSGKDQAQLPEGELSDPGNDDGN